ncbi:MAG: hypothetical protein ACJ0S4_07060 [Candidatus Rariloculaceae bacterium]
MRIESLRRSSVAIVTCMFLPAFAFAQGAADTESWPETKQRMIERGQQYDTAWAFYQSLESMAEDTTLEPQEVPDWTGLWGRRGGPTGLDTDTVSNRDYGCAERRVFGDV